MSHQANIRLILRYYGSESIETIALTDTLSIGSGFGVDRMMLKNLGIDTDEEKNTQAANKLYHDLGVTHVSTGSGTDFFVDMSVTGLFTKISYARDHNEACVDLTSHSGANRLKELVLKKANSLNP